MLEISKKDLEKAGWDYFRVDTEINLKDELSDVASMFKSWVYRTFPEWDGHSPILVIE